MRYVKNTREKSIFTYLIGSTDGVIFDYFVVDRIPSIIFFDGKVRLNEVPFNNISVDGISSLLDFTLDKKK